ncbi:hypothetical protein phiCPD_00090 [Clostridium phage phiCp-D]|nr:hypothetical protein phiCPD_00090 [Clostridium phage phiCp-D]
MEYQCDLCKQRKATKEDILVKGKFIKVYLYCEECYEGIKSRFSYK